MLWNLQRIDALSELRLLSAGRSTAVEGLKGCGDGDDYEGDEGTGQAQVTRGREFVGRSVNLWLSLRCFFSTTYLQAPPTPVIIGRWIHLILNHQTGIKSLLERARPVGRYPVVICRAKKDRRRQAPSATADLARSPLQT